VIDFLLEEVEGDVFLRREVVEDRPFGDAGLLGDLLRGGAVEPARLKEVERRGDDPLLRRFLGLGAFSRGAFLLRGGHVRLVSVLMIYLSPLIFATLSINERFVLTKLTIRHIVEP
jgi:hypothetical protein